MSPPPPSFLFSFLSITRMKLGRRIDNLPVGLRFTRAQHINYYDFASSLILNKDLRSFLTKIDQIIMGSETESPLKITPLHPSEEITAKIGLEVVKSTLLEAEKVETDQPEKDLNEMVQKHLNEVISDSHGRELVLKLFPTEKLSMKSDLRGASNDLIAKACGFPSLTIFKKFIDRYDDSNNVLEMDIKYLVSLLGQSENLSSDGYLHKFKDDLRQYKMAKQPENDMLPLNSRKQLDRIRSTVLRNIDFFFKYSPKRAENLSSFAERNGKYWKKFSKKEISVFKKLLFSSKSEQEEMLLNPSNLPVVNCFLCPALAKQTEPNKKKKKKNMYEFTTDWTAKIAVQKLVPIFDLEGVKKHWESHHGPNAITHGLVLTLLHTG